MDLHNLDCHIRQQADKEGNMPDISTKPTFHEEMPEAGGEGQWLMNREGVIYRANVGNTKSKPYVDETLPTYLDENSNTIRIGRRSQEVTNNLHSSKPNVGSASTRKVPDLSMKTPPPPTPPPSARRSRIDQMRHVRQRAQRSDQMDRGMVICDQEHMRMAREWREYQREARKKCLNWEEESRQFIRSHPEYQEDEAFMKEIEQEIEDDSVSGLSEAHR